MALSMSQAPMPGGHTGAGPYSMGMPASSSSLPVTVPPLLASIWGPLPIGRPSGEWQPSSQGQPDARQCQLLFRAAAALSRATPVQRVLTALHVDGAGTSSQQGISLGRTGLCGLIAQRTEPNPCSKAGADCVPDIGQRTKYAIKCSIGSTLCAGSYNTRFAARRTEG